MPDTGWVFADDGTIGSASSGSSNRANADTLALFTLFFNNMVDAASPLLTSGGGATTRAAQVSASAAWAANCRITLPRTCGRVLGVAGAGSGLTFRSPGTYLGSEGYYIAQNQLPNISPVFTGTPQTWGSNLGDYWRAGSIGSYLFGSGGTGVITYNNGSGVTQGNITTTVTPSGANSSINGNAAQQTMSTFAPTTFLNLMIKL